VHLSNLAAQTGASLFTQLLAAPYFLPGLDATLKSHSPPGGDWVYDKTENLALVSLLQSPSPSQSRPGETQSTSYTHLVVEDPSYLLQSPKLGNEWRVAEVVKAFDAWVLDWAALKGLLKSPLKGVEDGDGLRDLLLATIRRVLYVKESDKLWILERRSA
jgi:alpha-1,6-mannosyltransferase